MEKFAIDLDKVLDDFELEEDQRAQTRPTRIASPLKEIMQTPQLPAPVDLNLHREALPTKSSHREQVLACAERNLSEIQPSNSRTQLNEQNSTPETQIKQPEQVHTVPGSESNNGSEAKVTETQIFESPVNESKEMNLDVPKEEQGDLVAFGDDLPPPQPPKSLLEDSSSVTHKDLLDLEPWDAPVSTPPQEITHLQPTEAAVPEEQHEEATPTALNPPQTEEGPILLSKTAITFDSLPEVTDDELNSYLESLEEPEATPLCLPVPPKAAPPDFPALPKPPESIDRTEIDDSVVQVLTDGRGKEEESMTDPESIEESQDRSVSSDTDSSESSQGEADSIQPESLIREETGSILPSEMRDSEAMDGAMVVESAPEYSESSVSSQDTSPDPGSEVSLRSEVESNGLAASLEPYSSLSEEERMLGILKPFWIPDEDALVCMQCNTKFNVIKRRHHCRACGKVLCSLCCNMKAPLEYLDKKEGRVCQPCLLVLNKVEAYKKYASNQLEPNLPSPTHSGGSSSPMAAEPQHPVGSATTRRTVNPNNPAEYCSTVSPWQQMAGAVSRPPPAVYVPVGVLKKEGSSRGREPKNVVFSDGIRPGRDLTDMEGWGSPQMNSPVKQTRLSDSSNGANMDSSQLLCVEADVPPILVPSLQALSLNSHSPLSAEALTTILRDSDVPAVIFVVLKNLRVSVKLIQLDCCVKKWCWSFASEGLRLMGQDEILLVIEQEEGEVLPPKDIFQFYKTLFEEAAQGQVVTKLGHYLIPGPFLGTSDLGGFVFVRPSFQCLQKLPIPQPPYLVGLLIQRWETPWAKVFPLRLVLRLGAEFRYYPCPLISVRRRSPVFAEVGHTIINLLADMRNFTYCLPTIPGLRVHMENKQTSVLIPRNRYDKVCRALGQSNDHVLSFGASFSPEADSHLVCMQQEDGSYQTQAINIHNKSRSVIGASFIVFNGALKSASGLTATSTVVEDGIMLQLLPDTLVALRQALLNMKDFTIPCGRVAEEVDETVHIVWGPDDKNVNSDVTSPIDGRSLAGIISIRVPHSKEHKGEGKLALKWTELFLIQTENAAESPRRPRRPGTSGVETVDAMRLAENLARASCQALMPHVRSLGAFRVIAVRVTLDADTVEYEAGTGGHRLPPACMGQLDSALVPFLHKEAAAAANSGTGGLDSRIVIEVWLRIYHQ